jgi:hypothetical protein
VSTGFTVSTGLSVGGGVGVDPQAAKMKSADKLNRQVVRFMVDDGFGAKGAESDQKPQMVH